MEDKKYKTKIQIVHKNYNDRYIR